MKPKPQLLIVDNNVSMLRLLSNVLGDDYEIVAKLSPMDAYAWLQDGHHPALTIIDLQAAETPEFSLVKNLRISGMYRHMPVVVMTRSGQQADLSPLRSGRADACVGKPFNPRDLMEIISRLIAADQPYAA